MSKFELDLLDQAILAVLPDIGEKIGKYLPATLTVPAIKARVDPSYTSGVYGSRLRVLATHGYTTMVATHGARGHGWQRTSKGRLAAAHDDNELGVADGERK